MKEHLQEGEKVVYVARPSRITLIPYILLMVVAAGAGVAIYFATDQTITWMIGFAIAMIAGLGLLQRGIVLASNRYILTDRRVIKQTGIFTRNSNDSYLDKINNVEHRQSLWGRILGYGDVVIDTASETGMTHFPMIARPLEFKRVVLSASQDIRTGRFMPLVSPAAPSNAQKIRELKALLDEGLITAEEFEAKRRELLNEM
jgi:membrane protein YdbS with pleckstrin-like domain